MIKKKIEPIDLTKFTDEEIHYLGECFYNELKEVLDNNRPIFGNHPYYERLDEILRRIKAQLEKDERKAD